MTRLFGRTYDLVVGRPGETGRQWIGASGGLDLQLTFAITKKATRSGNKAEFTITNLSPASIGFLEQEGLALQFSAGYQGSNSLLFSGSISTQGVTTTLESTDRVTTIEAGDGELVIQQTRFDRAFNEGATIAEVLRGVAFDMGVGVGNLADFPEAEQTTYGTGFVYFGYARDALDEVTAQLGAGWSVQNGVLQFLRPGEATKTLAPVVSPSSGLIGSPQREKKGLSAVSLLNAAIQPGGPVVMESRDFNGQYKVTEVEHRGDYRGSEWNTAFKAKELS